MAFGKKNLPSVSPIDYNLCLLGLSKSGKTTLIFEVLEKLCPNGYLFVETGRERGADAISGIEYINCPTWSQEFDEANNAVGFEELINDIVKNKNEEYPNLKVLVVDTQDQLAEMAEAQIVKEYNRKQKLENKPTVDSINAAYAGYGRGESKARELVSTMEDKLVSVGVRVWYIGHAKTKDVVDPITNTTYTTITSQIPQSWFNSLKRNLHFLGLLYTNMNVVTEKKKVGAGEKKFNTVTSEARKIRWRSDNMVADCGSRFADIVEEIDCDADEFIKALTDAIDAEIHKSGMSDKQLKAEQKRLDEAKAEKVAANIEAVANGEELENITAQIMDFISENRYDKDKIKPIFSTLKKQGVKKPTEITDLNVAKEILALCK